MCLLWVLLQFVVLAMYWDVPPISSEAGAVMVEMKQEEGDEEEVPLMGSDKEPAHTYRAVSSDQLETSTSSEMEPAHGASAVLNPFKNFSVSGGERAGLTACPEQWLSALLCHISGAQVGRGVTANAHVAHLLYWFSCTHTHMRTHTHTHTHTYTHFPFSRAPGGILCGMSDQIPGVLIGLVCMCMVYVRVCVCVCIYMMSGVLLD